MPRYGLDPTDRAQMTAPLAPRERLIYLLSPRCRGGSTVPWPAATGADGREPPQR
jgi:hypothetical protein